MELTPALSDRIVRHHTALLAAAQVSTWLTAGVFVAAGALAVARLTGRASLSGLLFTIWALGLAVGAQATGFAMDRLGRRPGLAAGHALLGLASLTAAFSVTHASVIGLFGAAVLGGHGMGAALLGRAAMADMYPPQRRGVAVGYMLAAGTLGAVGGPQLVTLARALTSADRLPSALATAWLLAAAGSLLAFSCVLLLRPDPASLSAFRPTAGRPARRPLSLLLQLAPMRAAVLAMAIGQLSMYSIMAISTVAYTRQGLGLGQVSIVLSAHFSGMFAFSPVWGILIDRRGRKIGLLTAGALAVAGAVITGLAPYPALSGIGLFLIGLGWSGTYLGATAVISDFTTLAERGTALGFTDLASATAGAVGALAAGVLLDTAGFGAVGMTMMVLLLPAVALVGALRPLAWRPVALKPA